MWISNNIYKHLLAGAYLIAKMGCSECKAQTHDR
jgi:hypothetical protein